ncbi:hypothetical protein FEM48_Zijuj03G0151200 [Ziziphus jujuba var. spinosa]|uniref:FAR1 domain-containing protein n=1 Tax=Ziziphus jujuba var. spinosa TaxID=714518 RepID=A0A978VR10_ZIZJJ|nr:hypothetical protein FEM48_Zijuj03G0151200 [Ziziphus jujuba var. spinosa]
MDRDDDDFESLHESMDVHLKASNKLDLNVEQDCRSPKVVHANGAQSILSSKNEDSIDAVLNIGTEFESDEHAYKFYNKYARLVGFSVRKDWVNRSKVHGQVVSRKFTCSKEGYRRKDKRDLNVKKHRKETRTGCLAHMIITRQADGKYCITHFESQHNHDNVDPSNAQTLPLRKELGIEQAAEADSSEELGPRSKSAFESMNRRILLLSAKASESDEAFLFASRQLDELMEGVEKILKLKPDEAQAVTSSSSGANASECENTEIFLDENAIEDQDDNRIKLKGQTILDRGQLINVNEEGSPTERIQNVEAPPQSTITCISSSPPVYVSNQDTAGNSMIQGLYNFEANQAVHCLYQQPNLALDQQNNPSMYQPSNFFTNQHDSPGQSQLLQEPLIHNTYQESVSNATQLRQAMDLDVQNPNPSSFLLFDHRYRSSETSYLEHK